MVTKHLFLVNDLEQETSELIWGAVKTQRAISIRHAEERGYD